MSSQTACRLQKLKQLRLQKIFNEPCASRRVNKLNSCICEAVSNTQVGNGTAQNAGFTSPCFASAVNLCTYRSLCLTGVPKNDLASTSWTLPGKHISENAGDC